MKVFISWSGDRSRQLAEVLGPWLENVIQRLEPWVSIDDIDKGEFWSRKLVETLETTGVGIICVTRENMDKPWILFEAGALSTKGESRVTPYLLGLGPEELNSPLKQLNATLATKEETKRMLKSLNSQLGDEKLSERRIGEAFEKWWPDLEAAISRIPESPAEPPPPPSGDQLLQTLIKRVDGLSDQFKKLVREPQLDQAEKRINELRMDQRSAQRALADIEAEIAMETEKDQLAPMTIQRNRIRQRLAIIEHELRQQQVFGM